MKFQNTPRGLASLIAAYGGNYPSELSEVVQPTMEITRLIAASLRQIDQSGTGVSAGSVDVPTYPLLGDVPTGYLRWILTASASLQRISGTGGQMISGWLIRDGAGSIRPRSAITYGSLATYASVTNLNPYSVLTDIFLLSGERLGIYASAEAVNQCQIAFGIEYVDLKV